MNDIIINAKKNNKVFKYLTEYFDYERDSDDKLRNYTPDYLKLAYELYRDKRINFNELDILEDGFSDLAYYAIYVISLCPDIHIIFNNQEKGVITNNARTE